MNLKLSGCLMNASGCLCTTEDELDKLLLSDAMGAIVSKSSTVNPRKGNPSPRYFHNEFGSINSMGIPNFGYEFYHNYSIEKRDELHKLNKLFVQSLHPFNVEELKLMLTNINNRNREIKMNGVVEINTSCPNLLHHEKKEKDKGPATLEDYLNVIESTDTSTLTIGLKMPLLYQAHEFDEVTVLLLKYKNKIKFITCSNSLPNGLIIDTEGEQTVIHPKNGLGGIGGGYCKPMCLANVHSFYVRLKEEIDIVGCGGVASGEDVFNYILCGAAYVQVGTHLIKNGVGCFNSINKELSDIMIKKNYKSINDFKGKLKYAVAID